MNALPPEVSAAVSALALHGRRDPQLADHRHIVARFLGMGDGDGDLDFAMCEALDTADAAGFILERDEDGADLAESFMDVLIGQLESIVASFKRPSAAASSEGEAAP